MTRSGQTTPVSSTSVAPWPRRLELALAFVLGGGAVLLVHTAWTRWSDRGQPTPPLVLAIIDLNTADAATLAQLPGIGPQRAADIVAHRQRHGPFQAVEDLQAVPGIGPITVERLRPAVRLTANPDLASAGRPSRHPSGPPVPVVDLNSASARELQKLPGIGPILAERIVAERQRGGPFRHVDDLRRVRGIKDKTIDKLRPHVICGEQATVAGQME
jgi:competence ComEA-like helix-hairpin-helix protein